MKKKIKIKKQDADLARLISRVLRHKDLPDPLREGFREALTVTFNEHIDQTEILEYETSSPYISQIIEGYHLQQAQEVVQ